MFKTTIIFIILSIVICLLNFTTSDRNDKVCRDSWLHLTNSNKCFFYSQRKFNFTGALNFCRKNSNSTLFMISSKEENMRLSKILFDDLQFDEYFWLGGKVLSKKGKFKWLDSCQPVDYNNFHINNHEFNVDERNEEYIVITSAMNENKSKRKQRGKILI